MNKRHAWLWGLVVGVGWGLLLLGGTGDGRAATIPPPGTPLPPATPRPIVTAIPLPTAPPMQFRFYRFFPLVAK
jgi:hypothetical protein